MKRSLQGVIGVIGSLLLVILTLGLGPFIFLAILLKLLLPLRLAERIATPLVEWAAFVWVDAIIWWIVHVGGRDIRVEHSIQMSEQQWNLLVCNHLSFVDMFALFHATRRKLPILKFFVKKQLMWVPVLGNAFWAMDYPFMSRFSREYLEKHPEKAGQDLAATRIACQRFSERPTTVVNFLEGTRFTPAKYARQKPPYRHLLMPKSGGIAFAIQALGDRFDTVLDCTLHYEGGAPSTWDTACGRIGQVTVLMRKLEIPEHFSRMDYSNNPAHKAEFQAWVSDIWQFKDEQLAALERS